MNPPIPLQAFLKKKSFWLGGPSLNVEAQKKREKCDDNIDMQEIASVSAYNGPQ